MELNFGPLQEQWEFLNIETSLQSLGPYLMQALCLPGWSGTYFVDHDFLKCSTNVSCLYVLGVLGLWACSTIASLSPTLERSLQHASEACQVKVWLLCTSKHLETQKYSRLETKQIITNSQMPVGLFVWREPRYCSDFILRRVSLDTAASLKPGKKVHSC